MIKACLDKFKDEDTLAKAAFRIWEKTGVFIPGSIIKEYLETDLKLHEYRIDFPARLRNLTEFFSQDAIEKKSLIRKMSSRFTNNDKEIRI